MRHPTLSDLPAVAALLALVTATEFGSPEFPEDELRSHWETLPLERDAWLVISPEDVVVGYAALLHQDHAVLQAEGYVHPGHVGLGIGKWLIQVAETRATAHIALA